jgi:succinyl-diaminopimelate desuccinylase
MPTPSTAAHTWIARNEKSVVRFLQEIVSVDTINPPGNNYLRMVGVLQKKLRALGMTTRIIRVPQKENHNPSHPRFNLIGRWDTGAKKTLHFNSHYDVVPVADGWRFGPFTPNVNKGWLYGRGSADMKGCLAACLHGIEAVQSAGIRPAVNVEISLTADEETGGQLGAGYIVRKKLVKPDYAIVCEGGYKNQVGIGHNGVLWMQVTVHGKAAHGSRPDFGINAVEQAAEIINALQPFKKVLLQQRRRFKIGQGGGWFPTVNIGGVFSVRKDAKVNTVPGEASFTIDRRVVPTERLETAEREITAAIKRASQKAKAQVTIATTLRIPPCLEDSSTNFAQSLARSVSASRGGAADFQPSRGFSDMHYFCIGGKIPTLGYGVMGMNWHGTDERVEIKDLTATAKVFAHFLTTFKP